MKKTLLYLSLLMAVGSLPAQDKPADKEAQPTLEERFDLMLKQRDYLAKEVNRLQAVKESETAVATLQETAAQVGAKYNCLGWKKDFTCDKPAPKPEEPKK